MNITSLVDQLAFGQLANDMTPPDGLLDASHLLDGIRGIAAECSAIRVTDTGCIGRFTSVLTKMTADETVRAIFCALLLRMMNDVLGMAPKEFGLELTKPERLEPIARELSAIAVDISADGEVRPRYNELSVFTDPIRISGLHRLGFMVRQFPPRSPEDADEAREPLGDLDFEFIDSSEVEWDGERDFFEGFEEWIDWILQQMEQGEDDE